MKIVKRMMLLIVFFFIFIINLDVYAENEQILNPEWIKYIKLSEEEKALYAAIPEKYIYSEEEKVELEAYSTFNYSEPIVGNDALPPYYNLVKLEGKRYANSLSKNQSSLGLCWAFAAIGSTESNILHKGVVGLEDAMNLCTEENKDSIYCMYKDDYEINQNYINNLVSDNATLSERVVDYITAAPKDAKAYNRTGTYTVVEEGYNPYSRNKTFGGGGHFSYVGTLYSYGISPIRTLNDWAKYDTQVTSKTLTQIYDSVPNIYDVTDYYDYPSVPSDATEKEEWILNLKKNIMEYGSVYVSTVAPSSGYGRACYYYDNKYNIDGEKQYIHLINYDGKCGTGSLGWHAMQIIGWDDNYSFGYCKAGNYGSGSYTKDSCEAAGYTWAEGKGAWILKNSWGSSYSYPYLSYNSKNLTINGVREVRVKNYDNVYNYVNTDLKTYKMQTVKIDGVNTKQTIYRYTKPEGVEYLNQIKITLPKSTTKYKIYVSQDGENYDFVTEYTNDYAGLRTFDVNNYKLDGNEFYIKIVGGHFYYVNAFTKNECSLNNTCESQSINSVTDKQIYYKEHKTFNVFTRTTNIKSGEKIMYNIYNEANEDITDSFEITNNYIVLNTSKATLKSADFLPAGKYTLKSSYGDVENYTYFYVYSDITMTLKEPEETIFLDDETYKVTANLSTTVGVSKYNWSSSNENVATVDDEGNLDLLGSGKTTINLTLETYYGEVSDEIEIIVFEKINTIDEFMEIRNNSASKAYYLTTDLNFENIDFNNYAQTEFTSIFEGNYHTLENINISNDKASLFGNLNGAQISNIKILNSKFVGESAAASIATEAINSTLIGIYNEAMIDSNEMSGGIIAFSSNNVISESFNGAKINAISSDSYAYSGGLVAVSNEDIVENCYNTGSVYAESNWERNDATTYSYAGGIVGYNVGSVIDKTYNTGVIKADSKISNSYSYKSGITNEYYNVTNSYYLNDSTYNITDDSSHKTLDELMLNSTYSNWDFDNIWKMIEGKTTPTLRRFPIEVTNIDFNIFSKTLNTESTYEFDYEVVPSNSTEDIEIISEDLSLFEVDENKIITKDKVGSSYITFKVKDKEYSFPITTIKLLDIDYDKTLTGSQLDFNIKFNYYMSKLEDHYLKLVYNVNGEAKEYSFEKNVISDDYSFKVYNNGTISLGLYLCKETCELKYEEDFEITNIDKTNPIISYETNNILKTIKINVTDDNGLSEYNDYSYGLSSSNTISPTSFKKYQLDKTFNDLSLSNENYYLWIKRVFDKSGNATCDTPFCIYKLDLEDNFYTLSYYDEDQITLFKKEVLLENTKIKPDFQPSKPSTDNFDYEFSHWINYTDGMKLTHDTELIAKYKGIFRGLSSYTYVIENRIIKEIKLKDINGKYTFDEFKSNVSSVEEYKLYDQNFKLINTDYIKTGYIYKSDFRTFKISLAGDVTGDGYIKMNDVMKIANHIVNGNVLKDEYHIAGDVTGDGNVKMNDIMKIASGIVNGGSL